MFSGISYATASAVLACSTYHIYLFIAGGELGNVTTMYLPELITDVLREQFTTDGQIGPYSDRNVHRNTGII